MSRRHDGNEVFKFFRSEGWTRRWEKFRVRIDGKAHDAGGAMLMLWPEARALQARDLACAAVGPSPGLHS